MIGKIRKLRINPDELVFDLVLVLFVPLVYGLFLPDGMRSLTRLPQAAAVAVSCLVPFLVSLCLGRLYARYRERGPASGLLKLTAILTVSGSFLIPMAALASWDLIPRAWYRNELSLLFMIPALFGLAGVLAGFTPEHRREIKSALYLPWIAVLAFGSGWVLQLASEEKTAEAIALAGGATALLVVPLLLRKLAVRLFPPEAPRPPLMARLARAWQRVLFPGIFALALILWHEILILGIIRAAQLEKTTPDFAMALRSCLLSGIIPLRLLLALTPPRTRFHLWSAAVVLVAFILTTYGMLQGP